MPTVKKPSKSKDLPPKKAGAVKGGKLAVNDNLTFARVK
jgi:hypothetical protein